MKIVKYPTYYAPASGEVNFQISAEIDELVEIEILAGDDNTLIGKKRFRNATLYNVNVAGYARRQIDVTPQRPSSISFAQPANRLSQITIRSGSVQGSTVVAAGNNPLDSYIKLSASPETIPISRSQRDELALLVDDGLPLSVEARLHGRNGDKNLTIIDTQEVGGLLVICLNMTQLDAKLRTLEYGTLSDFDNMEVALMIDTDQLFAQNMCSFPTNPTRSDSAGGTASDKSITIPGANKPKLISTQRKIASTPNKDIKLFKTRVNNIDIYFLDSSAAKQWTGSAKSLQRLASGLTMVPVLNRSKFSPTKSPHSMKTCFKSN